MRIAIAMVVLGACGSPAIEQQSLFAAPVSYDAIEATTIAVADLDGDGAPDLVLAGGNGQGTLATLHNLGGAFDVPVTTSTGQCPLGVAVGDFDGDGALDAATADACEHGVHAMGQKFAAGKFPMALAAADLDGDGLSDLAVASYFDDGVSVLRSTGNRAFAPAVSYGSTDLDAIAIGDVDGDGVLDLVTATSGPHGAVGTVNVLLGHGDGTFGDPVSFPVGVDPESVALADLDGDGQLDAVTANPYDDGVSVVLGRGNGTFAAATGYPGTHVSQVAIADIDGDGSPDLVVATNNGSFDLRLNAGNGTFLDATTVPCGACGRVAIVDVDGDGAPDVVGIAVSITELGVGSTGTTVSVMRNAR